MTSPHNPKLPSTIAAPKRDTGILVNTDGLFGAQAPAAKQPSAVKVTSSKAVKAVVEKSWLDDLNQWGNAWADQVEKETPNGYVVNRLGKAAGVAATFLASCNRSKDINPGSVREVALAPGYEHGQFAIDYSDLTARDMELMDGFQLRVIEPGHVKPGQLKKGPNQFTYAYMSLGGLNIDNGDPDLIALNQKLSAIKPDSQGHSGFLTDTNGKVVTRMFDANNKIKMYDLRNAEAYKLVKEFALKKHHDYGGLFWDELDYVAAHGVADPRHRDAADAMGRLMREVSDATEPGTLIANGGVQDREAKQTSINTMIAGTHAFSCKENLTGRFYTQDTQGNPVPRHLRTWPKDDQDWLDGRMLDQIREAKAAGKKHFTLLVAESSEGDHKAAAARVKAKVAEYQKLVPDMTITYRFFGSDMSFTNERDLQANLDLAVLNGKRVGVDEGKTNGRVGVVGQEDGVRLVQPHITSPITVAGVVNEGKPDPAHTGHASFSETMHKAKGNIGAMTSTYPSHIGTYAPRNVDALFSYITSQVKDPAQQEKMVREAAVLVGKYSFGAEDKGKGANGDALNQQELEATLKALTKSTGITLTTTDYNAVAGKMGTKERLR